MQIRDIRDAQVRGRRVLVRVDYNIDVAGGRIRDTSRIEATVPTLAWLLKQGASIILVSHRGRPKGRQASLSLKPIVAPVQRLLKRPVRFCASPLFSRDVTDAVGALEPGQVLLLENIRFEVGEEENSPRVARRLAELCDVAVNDAFSDSHRAHASIVGIAKFKKPYAGLLLQREVKELSRLMQRPARPYVAILGGAKISTKLMLIKQLLRRADYVLLGGALANTILKAEGLAVGASQIEPTMMKAAHGLSAANQKLKIPCDVVVAAKRSGAAKARTTAVGNITPREIILDIGPDTVDFFGRVIAQAKTIAWNGPMGVYEIPRFSRGTTALARLVGKSRARTIAGGGETLDAIRRANMNSRFTFLSTGGGAMLEFLEGRSLPGVDVVRH